MASVFHGRGEQIAPLLLSNGIDCAVSMGRRAPMHIMHMDCLREILDSGLRPVIVIGSVNGSDSELFDPIRNPMTLPQQIQHLKLALGDDADRCVVVAVADYDTTEEWMSVLLKTLKTIDAGSNAAMHFRSKAADAKAMNDDIKPLSAYEQSFIDGQLSVWQSFNANPADDLINASDLRIVDLENLPPAAAAVMVMPDYIVTLARDARANNPDGELLTAMGVPLTFLDLSFERLYREAGISTKDIINKANSINIQNMTHAAQCLLAEKKEIRKTFNAHAKAETVTVEKPKLNAQGIKK